MKRYKKIWLCFILLLVGEIIIGTTIYLGYKNLSTNSNNEQVEEETTPNGGSIPNMVNPSSNMTFIEIKPQTLTTPYIISIVAGSLLISLSLVYFLLSKRCTKSLLGSEDKKTIIFLSVIIISFSLSYMFIYLTNNHLINNTSNKTQIIDKSK